MAARNPLYIDSNGMAAAFTTGDTFSTVVAAGWQSPMSPSADQTVPASYTAIVARIMTLASGRKITLSSGSILRIL